MDNQVIQGAKRLVGTFVAAGNRMAFVAFVDKDRVCVLSFVTSVANFASAEALMKELAERRFKMK